MSVYFPFSNMLFSYFIKKRIFKNYWMKLFTAFVFESYKCSAIYFKLFYNRKKRLKMIKILNYQNKFHSLK